MRALVVDDSRAMRKVISRMAAALGAEVHEAGDGAEGLSVLHSLGHVDVVLTDLHMPVMNGIELVRAVRAEPSWERTLVCIISSDTEPTSIARGLMAGADEYLMKPVTAESLEEMFQRYGIED
jgi:two-component system chemotaxis response regulator CheY